MKVLVAYDRTEGAEAALRAASALAGASGELLLVHAVPLGDLGDVFEHHNLDNARIKLQDERRDMAQRAAELPFGTGQSLVEVLERDEAIASGLVRLARAHGAALIAIGTRRAGTLSGAVGSITEALVRLSPIPVLVVPPTEVSRE
jgi:nucleotide-binding universal stress UspA family protein